jgi:uncharacterized integral membrane protein
MKWKLLVTVGLFIFVMVFAVQNAADVEIRLLFWQVTFPRSLLIFMMLMIGMIIGWFGRSRYRISRHKRRDPAE